MALSFSPKIVTDGLVLYLDAANTHSYPPPYNGTTWTDLAGTNNGTLVNGPTFNSGNGGSIVFDGVNDYIQVSDINNISQLSVESWVYANSVGSYNAIASQFRANAFSLSSWVLETVGSDIRLYIANGSSLVYSSTPFDISAWVHIIGTFDGTTARIYKNGIAGATTGTTAAINNSNLNINIGALYNSGGTEGSDGRWNGKISNVKLYNRALNATEILQNYNATKGRYL